MIARSEKKQAETAQMIALSREGKTLKEIGEVTGFSPSSVHYRLRSAGEPRRPVGRPRSGKLLPPAAYHETREKVRRAKELAKAGLDQFAIAKVLDLSQGRVSQMLRTDTQQGDKPTP